MVGSGGRVGGQGGCERRIEVFEKIHKKWGVFGLGVFGFGDLRVVGVRLDVNEESKFL